MLEWLEPTGGDAMRTTGCDRLPAGPRALAAQILSTDDDGALLWSASGDGWAWASKDALTLLEDPGEAPPWLIESAWRRGLLTVDGQRPIDEDTRLGRIDAANDVHTLVLLLSSGCNLACTYCYLGHEAPAAWRRMPPETWGRAIDAAFTSRKSGVLIDCGEISVARPVYHRVVRHAQAMSASTGKPVWFAVQTNGAGLDDAVIAAVAPQSLHVGISIDGPASLHDRARPTRGGRGSWQFARAAIERCQRHGIQPLIICTVARHNVEHPDRCVDAILALGATRVLFKPVLAQGEAAGSWKAMGVSPEEFAAFAGTVLRRSVSDRLRWMDSMSWKFLRRILGDPGGWRDACTSRWCGSGRTLHVVDASGGLHACPRYTDGPSVPLPSAGTLPDILAPGIRTLPQSCEQCSWKVTCGGGCTLAATSPAGPSPVHDPHCASHFRIHQTLVEDVLPLLRRETAIRGRLGIRMSSPRPRVPA